jgi:hypothetical protein
MTESVWIHYARPRPHWYALGEAERDAHRAAWRKVSAGSAEAGGRCIGPYHIRGQHDFETVEIWTFPSVDAALDHWVRLAAAGYNEWFAFANNIGLAAEAGP